MNPISLRTALVAYLYDIDPDRSLAIVRLPAIVDVAGLLDTQQGLYLDAAWQPGMNEVWDGRNIRQLRVSLEGLRSVVGVAAALRDRIGGGRLVLVAPRTIDFSIARLYTALHRSSPQEMKVFRTIEEAEAWLHEGIASMATAG